MTSYRVPNDNGVFVNVTEADLNEELARKDSRPIPAQFSHAAAIAKRKDFIPKLRQTLRSPSGVQKRAAASALLALNDKEAPSLLDSNAKAEKDAIVASMFKIIALRLRNVDLLAQHFTSEDDPQTSRLVMSMYNSYIDIEEADVRFLVEALEAYLNRSLQWIRKLKSSHWENAIALAVGALASSGASAIIMEPYMSGTRTKACGLLRKVLSLDLAEDIQSDAKAVLERCDRGLKDN